MIRSFQAVILWVLCCRMCRGNFRRRTAFIWSGYFLGRYTSAAGISPWHVYFHDGYGSVAGKPLQDYRFWIKLTAGNYQACFTKINAFVQSGSELWYGSISCICRYAISSRLVNDQAVLAKG